MKRYIYSAAVLALAFACSRIEEVEPENLPVEAVKMQLTAMMDSESAVTKTYLDGSPVASVRNTWWLPEDTIAVVGKNGSGEFINKCTDTTEVALFEGLVNESDSYFALYPESMLDAGSTAVDKGVLGVILPDLQYYEPDRFHTDMVPMVTKFQEGDSLYFRNICGGFVFKLTGTEIIKAISFVAYAADGTEAAISGQFIVDMNSETLGMTPTLDSKSSVSVYCGEGIQLKEDEPTAFHLVLPPAVYKGFKISVVSTDGQFMNIASEKDLNIRRANITYAPSLEFKDNLEPIDLSRNGTANCYIVSDPGVYSFDATVIGNGLFGLIERAGFHTDDPTISPEYVEVLWQDRDDVVSDVKLIDGKVRFISSGTEGNVLIAVKDASGVILWSWHIWVTDRPKEHQYVNSTGNYTVLDRNLGAIRADRGTGDEWMDASGLMYQWGRKDPFAVKNDGTRLYNTGYNSKISVETSITAPTSFVSIYDPWNEGDNVNLWTDFQKTIYDPCPSGYRMIDRDAFRSFTKDGSNKKNDPNNYNVVSSFDMGWNFLYDGSNSSYYPVARFIQYHGSFDTYLTDGFVWSSSSRDASSAWRLRFGSNSSDSFVEPESSERKSYGFPVRCMKDADVMTIFEDIEITDLTSVSVKVTSVSYVEGGYDEKGFVYGTSSDVTLETGEKIDCTDGELSSMITGLTASTKYYVRTYIVKSGTVVYSNAKSFVTPDADGVYDLSAGGTANSYIVSQPGTYKFNATVKGNSTEGFEYAESASVLWETLNTDNLVEIGDVVTGVAFDGTYISFKTPAELVPGNALIALRDDEDKILWSWHIWVTDQNPEGLAVEYEDGSLVMDRNLGALTNDVDDVRSFGLFYQWGRKDPFVGCGNLETLNFAATAPSGVKKYVKQGSDTDILSYAVSHPTNLIQDSKWNEDNTLWRSVKTMHDPCPAGWRVADFSTMEDKSDYSYPFAGYTEGKEELLSVGSKYYVWTIRQDDGTYGIGSYVGPNKWTTTAKDVHREYNVRCMKDADFALINTMTSDITPYSVKVASEVVVSDGTVIERRGFVINDKTSLRLDDEGAIVVDAGNGQGEFSQTITNLLPNKTYYVRAFAVGGHNTKYGDVITFMTDNSGNGEDFKDGGNYEWE